MVRDFQHSNKVKSRHSFELQLFSCKTAKFQVSGQKTPEVGTSSVSYI